MKTAMLGILVISSLSCSGSGEPEACDLAHRDGTYLQTATERDSGTCGAIPDTVVRIDNAGDLPPGCTKDAPDSASRDRCEYSRSYSCELDGLSYSFVGSTREHEGGARFTGISTMTVRDADGSVLCVSTYDLDVVRQ